MFTNIDNCHHMDSPHYQGPKNARTMELSLQNQEWEKNRPRDNKFYWGQMQRFYNENYLSSRKVSKRKKYSNSLTSHHGESRISAVEKMSGWITEMKNISRRLHISTVSNGEYSSYKEFYRRKKRRMLKNPMFFEKF